MCLVTFLTHIDDAGSDGAGSHAKSVLIGASSAGLLTFCLRKGMPSQHNHDRSTWVHYENTL